MQPWQLPEHVADILPTTARQSESARKQVLELFRVYGYELVQPPLTEYSGSLLTHIDKGLSLKTIRVVNQISGKQLGIRADIMPQMARTGVYLLSANEGINRLCYAGPVLHMRPGGLLNTREPLQVNTELYDLAGAAADIELIDLMSKNMGAADIGGVLLSLGHISVFCVLACATDLDEVRAARLPSLIRDKDTPVIPGRAAAWRLDDMWVKAFVPLSTFYDGREILTKACAELPDLSAADEMLDELKAVCRAFPLQQVHVSLSELRADEYHIGLLFVAHGSSCRETAVRGGRYSGLGAYSGQSRPATGFSFDMYTSVGRLPTIKHLPLVATAHGDTEEAGETTGWLRAQRQCIMVDYGAGYNGSQDVSGRLKRTESGWEVFKIQQYLEL